MPTDKLVHPTSFRCPPALYRSLKKLSDKQGCPVTFKIIQILTSYVDAYKTAHPEERV